jgi:hypothetical protein
MLNTPRSITDEDAKVYTWIVELVQGDRRETALLELSKKREQVEDLAVILWHSVGAHRILPSLATEALTQNCAYRCHDLPAARNHLGLPAAYAVKLDCRRIEQGVQRPCSPTVRGVS